ncbi:hypothetical protein BT93_L5859 [Corymbia citriodora subsp. variegata]|uniref:Neprosin PEP catalytic domain-containing protein n=1 Tax=Corymbia citriodora subsp. variegata TaxID=360336 RepID=A0A8T0CTK6_CORYI|nr:hypothetical protein BT93_L5859 [Corymbia citriodora subsp. variegata]
MEDEERESGGERERDWVRLEGRQRRTWPINSARVRKKGTVLTLTVQSKMKVLPLLFVFFGVSLCEVGNISEGNNAALERQVKMMNKPPIKTFVTAEGDTIDCIDIDKQPSLEHPLLKNHKVQVVSLVDNKIENTKYGAYGRTSIYNITVARGQFSSHNIWIQNGSIDHVSMIVAGWTVSPQLYGDTLSHFFTYWTGDGYRDGCFNLLCPGFVLVDRRAIFNTPLNGSTYGGQQYELAILVQQDLKTGNWWLMIGYPPAKVGYWPMEIFSNLQNGALVTAWGGTGFAGSDGVCPPIGSGHKPDGDYRHATYFRILHWIDAKGVFVQPSKDVAERVDSDVYDLKNYHYDRDLGYWIGYGGPGGYCYE